MTSHPQAARPPANWRSLTVAELRKWIRANGGAPPYLGEMTRYEIEKWIERYYVAANPSCDCMTEPDAYGHEHVAIHSSSCPEYLGY